MRVLPWVLLDTATIPGGGGELRLMRRGGDFSIMQGRIELMNSRLSGSEEALAHLACRKIADRPHPHILIGGLGMGFTLREALAELGPQARIVVAELVPAVVEWARGPMAAIFGGCLDDPRVGLHLGDARLLIGAAPQAYDAVLLDVDNGPEALTRPANDALYDASGLADAFAALRPGGVLAVWSAGPSPAFAQRLRRIGFAVEEVQTRARGKSGGARHVIWLATRPVTARR